MYRKLDFNTKIRNATSKLVDGNGPFKINYGGKLKAKAVEGARPIPWIFLNHDARKKFCWFWNNVCTGHFKIIPTHCRFNCWKTVIKPNNVKELFECYDILKRLDLPSKIGMDLREYTYGAWAGFVYADSLNEGREYYKLVRGVIPKNVSVILKRGCTEMEQLQSSDKWDSVGQDDIDIENKLHDRFSFDERHYQQAAWHKQEIKENWIKHAIRIGDPTAQETAEKMSDNLDIWKKLVVISKTYHDKDPRIKEENK